MTSRTAAARYARAALDVATKESADLDRIARELDEFTAFFKQQPVLDALMLNPAAPAPRKRAAMEHITRISGFTSIVAKLLILLADRDRLALLKVISAAYHDLLADRQNVVRAEVNRAEPLADDRLNAIEAAACDGDRQARRDDSEGGQGHHRRGRRSGRQHSCTTRASRHSSKKIRDRLTT